MSASSNSRNISPLSAEAVSPADIITGTQQHHLSQALPMSSEPQPEPFPVPVESPPALPLKTGRTARFAESTTVHSPVQPAENDPSPFADPFTMAETPHHVSDVGFGYVNDNDPARHVSHPPLTPASPPRSALRTPGTPGRLNPLSPTFKEEMALEKREKKTEEDNAKDLVGPPPSIPYRQGERNTS
jgi:hypothetical protein